MDRDEIREAFALDDFYFEGIGNIIVRGPMFRLTFFTWEQDESGLFKFGVRRARCPVESVPDCAQQALAAVARQSAQRFPATLARVLS